MTGRYLSRSVYSVISMFDPGVVLIGGDKRTGKALHPLLTRHLETFEMWEALEVPIQPCQHREIRRAGWAYRWRSKARQKLARVAAIRPCIVCGGPMASAPPGKGVTFRAINFHNLVVVIQVRRMNMGESIW